MAPTTPTKPSTATEGPVLPKDLLRHLQSTPGNVKDDDVEPKNDSKSENIAHSTKKEDVDESVTSTPKKVAKKAAKKVTDATEAGIEKPSKEVVKNMVKKADEKKDTELADTITPSSPVEFFNTPTVPHPADIPSVFDTPATSSTTAVQMMAPGTKEFVRSGGKGFQSPLKKAAAKPAPIDTTISTMLQKPVVPPAPATPMKRAPEGTLTPPPDMKRIKADTVPALTPTQRSRIASASPNPRMLSLEAQVAEQRKLVEAARKKRAEMARKKAAVDEKLAPYKQRMAEELERLRQEMVEVEAMMVVEEEDYLASEAMLAEFEQGDGGF
jgi:hypothetical protein